MPIYSYRCNDCEYEFDQRQRMSDDPLTICPACKGTVRRVVNSVGVVFKGSGFYVTDNRSKNSAKNSAISTNGKSEDTASNDGKVDEKKAAAPAVDTKQTTSAASTAATAAA